ncbi:MAG: prolyl oligopeptidase family serine peptidase [Verrucomicrobiae bacterium]|jgi:dienelactone hydrolase|nr:prolyl oligopeptidase family serine peptidase [Verrucomicrobiae bacterium]
MRFATRFRFLAVLATALLSVPANAAQFRPNTSPTAGDLLFENYFEKETGRIESESLADIRSVEDWKKQRPTYHRQLLEMLGLDPLPEKTDLKASITGKADHADFTVENLHFQSRPGLYVTGNLYLPKNSTNPAPAVLYVCGHGKVKKDGVSYGNKTHYQHHGAWFARNGYVCLIIDTIQLGEIEGIHHGTYREGMWWWNSRGYTPAGVEAWNCVRALDYLQSRPEVDGDRLGVTGRSGGGAYSWWIAAIDERIKVAAPVAGITDLRNHVVDGVVEGHCDCMFHVNTHRWDFAQIAALVAPRPLLLCNTDDDRIFPLDGVNRVYEKVRRIYDLHGARKNLGLVIIPGPHSDTQPLRVPVFSWFNHHLKADEKPITIAAEKVFDPAQLKVFAELPKDEITSRVHDTFTKTADEQTDTDPAALADALHEKVFRGWPETPEPLDVRVIARAESEGLECVAVEFTTQSPLRLRAYVARPLNARPKALHLEVIREDQWPGQLAIARAGFASAFEEEFQAAGIDPGDPVPAKLQQTFRRWAGYIRDRQSAYVTLAVRGVGNTALKDDDRHRIQTRRRFQLLGQTLAGMRVYDVVRSVSALRTRNELKNLPLHLWAGGEMANIALLAALNLDGVEELHLSDLALDDRLTPDFLNLSRVTTWPNVLHAVRSRSVVSVADAKKTTRP